MEWGLPDAIKNETGLSQRIPLVQARCPSVLPSFLSFCARSVTQPKWSSGGFRQHMTNLSIAWSISNHHWQKIVSNRSILHVGKLLDWIKLHEREKKKKHLHKKRKTKGTRNRHSRPFRLSSKHTKDAQRTLLMTLTWGTKVQRLDFIFLVSYFVPNWETLLFYFWDDFFFSRFYLKENCE